MSGLLTVTDDTGGATGKIYLKKNIATTAQLLTMPGALFNVGNRPAGENYRKRLYVVGEFQHGFVYTEFGGLHQLGLPAPTVAPVLSTSGTGITGPAIGYYTFAQFQDGVLVHQSNPSPPSNTLTLTNQGRGWSAIQATCLNPRATHVLFYVSMSGANPRLAAIRTIGVTSFSENTATASLRDDLPVRDLADGSVELDIYARGVPPYCKYIESYNDAMFYAGDPNHPDRIYFSRLREPESVDTTENTVVLRTKDGEAVTGLRRYGDELIVGTRFGIYAIQGFSVAEYRIRKISSFYNVLTHHSMVRVGPQEDLYFASQQGPVLYNGNFRFILEDYEADWQDAYRANIAGFEDCFAIEDRRSKAYILQIPQPDSALYRTFRVVLHYEPVLRGQQPWVTFDRRVRREDSMGVLRTGQYGEVYSGSCGEEGNYVRRENDYANADDDGDEYAKTADVTTKHFFMGSQDGDDGHGRDYVDLDAFVKTENQATTVSLYGGDDSAREAATPQWSRSIAASAVTSPRAKVPKTAHHFSSLTGISGKGVCVRYTVRAPIGWEYRGQTIYFVDGVQDRPDAA